MWGGRRRPEAADEYEAYYSWESVEAGAAFTGADPTAIHHLGRDAE
jgi:hypothetical protein